MIHRSKLAVATLSLLMLLATRSNASATSILVWSTGNGQANTGGVAAWIQTLGGFTSVTGLDTQNQTLEQLTSYDEVFFFTNGSGDSVNNGNVLADYADTGRRLVLSTFSWANQGGNTLGGRIITDGISPFLVDGGSLYSNVTMQSNDGSAFFAGVNSLSGFFHDNVSLTTGATLRGMWSDGEALVATRGNVVAVNLFPDDSYGFFGGDDHRQLFVNALDAETAQTVPEPASLLLVGTGLIASLRRWRKRTMVS